MRGSRAGSRSGRRPSPASAATRPSPRRPARSGASSPRRTRLATLGAKRSTTSTGSWSAMMSQARSNIRRRSRRVRRLERPRRQRSRADPLDLERPHRGHGSRPSRSGTGRGSGVTARSGTAGRSRARRGIRLVGAGAYSSETTRRSAQAWVRSRTCALKRPSRVAEHVERTLDGLSKAPRDERFSAQRPAADPGVGRAPGRHASTTRRPTTRRAPRRAGRPSGRTCSSRRSRPTRCT